MPLSQKCLGYGFEWWSTPGFFTWNPTAGGWPRRAFCRCRLGAWSRRGPRPIKHGRTLPGTNMEVDTHPLGRPFFLHKDGGFYTSMPFHASLSGRTSFTSIPITWRHSDSDQPSGADVGRWGVRRGFWGETTSNGQGMVFGVI